MDRKEIRQKMVEAWEHEQEIAPRVLTMHGYQPNDLSDQAIARKIWATTENADVAFKNWRTFLNSVKYPN